MSLNYSKALKPVRGGKRPGSGRKPRNTITVTFRLSPNVITALHLAAKELQCSMSEIIDKSLKKYLKKYLSNAKDNR